MARDFGAEGIGLCRTEHMFFEGDRIKSVREMILADDLAAREKALAKLLPMQRDDFEGIFKAMDGLPVTIRTLDPPLHEFLPHVEERHPISMYWPRKWESAPNTSRLKVESLARDEPHAGHPRLPPGPELSPRSRPCRPGPSSRPPAS